MRPEMTLRRMIEPALELLVVGDVGRRPMKTWRWNGSVAAMSGAFDSEELSTGTSRKPSSAGPLATAPFGDDVLDMGAQCRVARHEEMADAILAGRRQLEALRGHLLAEEAVGNLHQHAGAVAHQRIGADGAAMRQVFEHGEAVLDDLVRLDALHVDDEADAAGIMLVARIVEARATAKCSGRRISAVAAVSVRPPVGVTAFSSSSSSSVPSPPLGPRMALRSRGTSCVLPAGCAW